MNSQGDQVFYIWFESSISHNGVRLAWNSRRSSRRSPSFIVLWLSCFLGFTPIHQLQWFREPKRPNKWPFPLALAQEAGRAYISLIRTRLVVHIGAQVCRLSTYRPPISLSLTRSADQH